MADIAHAQTATAAEVLAADVTANALELENDSADTLYLKWAASGLTVSESAYSMSLAPGEKVTFSRWFARLRLIGVWSTVGSGTLRGLRTS
ncbi:MAG: hypothetical protein IT382_16985 [Deltaproteobacteria bacterium]|nr:hypothetical protein [Deltaproteobacteria bacterium]